MFTLTADKGMFSLTWLGAEGQGSEAVGAKMEAAHAEDGGGRGGAKGEQGHDRHNHALFFFKSNLLTVTINNRRARPDSKLDCNAFHFFCHLSVTYSRDTSIYTCR